ncbi:MAG: endonuclease/exonuclease/phosphatase family protein [Polyangiales bacterium]
MDAAVDVPSPVMDAGRADVPRDTGPRDTGVRDTGVRDPGPIVGDPCRGPNQPTVLRVMTFNIKSAQVTNLNAIASVINDARVDLVALQEVDRDSNRSGRVDQAARLGALTRMNYVFRATRPLPGGQYGVALLSRFDVLSAVAHDLPAEGFEPRVYVDARLDLGGGRRLRVGFTHLDFHVDAAQPQVREVLRLTASSPPALILGDFNFTPDRPVHDVMAAQYRDVWSVVGDGRGPTVPARSPGARIDYVWITRGDGALRPLCAYVPNTTASDHRPVVAAFPMP